MQSTPQSIADAVGVEVGTGRPSGQLEADCGMDEQAGSSGQCSRSKRCKPRNWFSNVVPKVFRREI